MDRFYVLDAQHCHLIALQSLSRRSNREVELARRHKRGAMKGSRKLYIFFWVHFFVVCMCFLFPKKRGDTGLKIMTAIFCDFSLGMGIV